MLDCVLNKPMSQCIKLLNFFFDFKRRYSVTRISFVLGFKLFSEQH